MIRCWRCGAESETAEDVSNDEGWRMLGHRSGHTCYDMPNTDDNSAMMFDDRTFVGLCPLCIVNKEGNVS